MNMNEGPMDGAKRGGIEGGRWVWVGWGKVVVGKWRQLYSNLNKKRRKKGEVVNIVKKSGHKIALFDHVDTIGDHR